MAKVLKYIILVVLFVTLFSTFEFNSGTHYNEVSSPIEFADASNRDSVVGMGAFGVLHPKFPISQMIKILKRVKHKNVAISFPYGTFGSSPINYNRIAQEMKTQGKQLHTVIYGICGPCRKPRRSGQLEIFYPKLTIKQLNSALVRSEAVREDYRNLISKIKTDFIDPYPDQTFDFFPELEDSLTDTTAGILYNIASEVFAENPNVRIVQNPLVGVRRFNLAIEYHNTSPITPLSLRQLDSINFDGDPFNFKKEKKSEAVSFDSIKKLVALSHNRRVDIYLWRGEWQGIPNSAKVVNSGRDRPYKIINDSEIVELLNVRSRTRVPLKASPVILPNPSTFNCKIVNRDYPFLYKPESDHSGPPREDRPMSIFPKRKPSGSLVPILNALGEEIGFMKEFPGDESLYGRRFYVGTGSGQSPRALAEKAIKTSGISGDIYLKVGKGICVGPISATVRVDARTPR